MSFARKLARRQARLERKHPGIGDMRVKCRDHGKKPWFGDIVCAKCGAIHLIDDETKEHPTMLSGDNCTCGAPLFPIRDEQGKTLEGVPFYGRIACRDCARKTFADQQAKAPS